MVDVEIKYNNATIASLNDSGTEVLETNGTYLTDDITVEYTKSGGGGDSDARLAALIDKSITDIVIPNGAMSIGTNAFYGCSSLTSITCEAITPPTLRSNVFNKVPDTCAIYVPAESVAAYKAANNWSNRAAYIQAIQTT